jgi:hypothetical protein
MDTNTVQKLEYILSGYNVSQEERNEIIDLMENYAKEQCNIADVIWRCNEDITNIYGETIFTKGLVYEQIKYDEYPMMLVDNKVEESEVSNLEDCFTSI